MLLVTLYIQVIRRIVSFAVRNYYLAKITEQELSDIRYKIVVLEALIKNKSDIDKELKNFVWQSDAYGGLLDWSPDITTFLYRQKHDDCDGAAFYVKYLFALIGASANIYSLVSKSPLIAKSHVICVVNLDGKYQLYSNGYCYQKLFDTEVEAIMNYRKQTESATLKFFDSYYLITY